MNEHHQQSPHESETNGDEQNQDDDDAENGDNAADDEDEAEEEDEEMADDEDDAEEEDEEMAENDGEDSDLDKLDDELREGFFYNMERSLHCVSLVRLVEEESEIVPVVKTRLDALPDEVLARIFSNLHCVDLLRLELNTRLADAIRRLCWEKWSLMEWNSGFLRESRAGLKAGWRMNIDPNFLMATILRRCASHVQQIYLGEIVYGCNLSNPYRPQPTMMPWVFPPSLPMLHTLDLSGVRFPNADALIQISTIVGTTLKSLNLHSVFLHDYDFTRQSILVIRIDVDDYQDPPFFSRQQFSLFLRNMPHLESLKVSSNAKYMPDLSFEDVSPSLQYFESCFTTLHPSLLSQLARRTQLEGVHLMPYRQEWSLESIESFLSRAKELKSIFLATDYKMEDETPERVLYADQWACTRSLLKLSLGGYTVAMPRDKSFSNLHCLELSRPRALGTSSQHFEGLDQLVNLECLRLVDCPYVTDKHLHGLAMLGRIKVLMIRQCPLITTACLKLFLIECKGLKWVGGSYALLSNDALALLHTLLDNRSGEQRRVLFYRCYEDANSIEPSHNMHPNVIFSSGKCDEEAAIRRSEQLQRIIRLDQALPDDFPQILYCMP